jgi:hypothetical protein
MNWRALRRYWGLAFPGTVQFLRVVVGLGQQQAADERVFKLRGKVEVAVKTVAARHFTEQMAHDAPQDAVSRGRVHGRGEGQRL